jgi:archaellum component FlaC
MRVYYMKTNHKQFKAENRPDLLVIQLQYETDTWKRLLGFLMEENTYLKNRLSEILKNGFNENLLGEVENYQTRFIKEDELIDLIRNDVAELDNLLVREVYEDGKIISEIRKKLKSLSSQMSYVQNQFTKLKSEFNSFLSENI